tara:strand:+ start:1042 stop:1707 length:666 start_codon:yes stop_codon:yes gene_type:complete
MFDYFSSPIVWCETKLGYQFYYSPYIVEFWNSVSSLTFCLLALYGYYSHKNINLDYIPWIYLFLIGVTSTWFHATLSFLGKFFDELFIILLITYCLRIFFKINIFMYLVTSIFLSTISWFYPSFSPIILMFFGFFLILSTYLRVTDKKRDLIWYNSIKIGIFSVFTWIFDFLCFFNTHMFWHIFIGLSAYNMILFVLRESNKNLYINGYYLPKLKNNSKEL